MAYRVIKLFTDLQDKGYKYEPGDTFPRPGLEVTPGRIAELASNKNLRGIPLIEAVDEPDAENVEGGTAANEKLKRRKRKIEAT